MKIKEAAARTGLSEKAIRFYESKKLITPQTRQLNGRSFREYTEENVRDLARIAALRRAYFSIGQIAEMMADGERCSAVFAAYKEEQTSLYREMTPLVERLASVDGESITTIDSVVAAVEGADRQAPAPRELHFHRHEDLPDEEKAAAYRIFLKHQRRRDLRDAILSRIGRFVKWAAIAAGVLAVLLLVYGILDGAHIDTPVTITMDAVEWKEYDPDYCVPRTVTLTGVRENYLLGPDRLRLNMTVSGYEYKDFGLSEAILAEVSAGVSTQSGYYRPVTSMNFATRTEDGASVTFDDMRTDAGWRMGCITVFENEGGTGSYDPERGVGSIISFTAKNREDAEAIHRFFRILRVAY